MHFKNNQRTIWGVGPKLILISLIFSLPVIIFAYLTHPEYVIHSTWALPFQITGALLTISGFIFYIISAKTMAKAFKQNKLVTTGVFGVCRNPIYSAWMLAIIPGIAICVRMPLLLLIPVIMYIVFSFIKQGEEKVLVEIFGEEYLTYRANVNAVFPTIFCKN
jgi:protein-S-isoprenylcysteine O-methyltransferase Ste14